MGVTRDYHDRVLARYGAPAWLVHSEGSGNFAGPDLRHDRWIVRTDDPALLRNSDRTIDFTLPVDARAILLNDRPTDLLSAKILTIEALNGQLIERKAAGACVALASNFGWLVRWRLALGIERTSSLTPAILEKFFAKLGEGGVYALIPFQSRLDDLEARMRAGIYTLPITERTRIVQLQQVYAELGVASKVLPKPLSAQVVDMIRRVAPEARFKSEGLRDWRRSHALQRDQVDEGDTAIQPPAVSFSEQVLSVFADLHRLSLLHALDHDPLTFDPFLKTSLYKRARQIGRPASRTSTMGPEQWLALLETAAKWVMDLAGPATSIAHKAREIAGLAFTGTRGQPVQRKAAMRETFRAQVDKVIEEHWPIQLAPRGVMPAFARSKHVDDAEQRFTINEIVYYVVASSFLLTGAFAARRRRELESLQSGCMERDPVGGWWLSSYIEKTIRDVDRIPVPASVGLAVRHLEDLSRPAREALNSPWLADVLQASVPLPVPPGTGLKCKKYHTDCLVMIKDLAAISDIPLDNEGNAWNFTAHQLRRAFAVFYYYGYRCANLDSLSRFLRHFDPEMTRIYITDVIPGLLVDLKERRKAHQLSLDAAAKAGNTEAAARSREEIQQIEEIYDDLSGIAKGFGEIKERATVERVLEIFDGIEEPIGRDAAVIYRDLEKMIEDVRQDVRIKSPNSNGSPTEIREGLIPHLKSYAKTKNMEPVPGGIATCGWSPKRGHDLSLAGCISIKATENGGVISDVRQDYAYASVEVCLECPFGLAFSQNERVIEQAMAEKADAAARAPSEALRTAARSKLDSYKATLNTARAVARRL